MNERASFVRKIIYVCAIAVLLLPLSWLSQPETTESEGGTLARLRVRNHLAQASLGNIDPASETMKLATLGLRGVATNLLWEKAIECKKKEDWTGLTAALEQITRLEPNFIAVWRFQAWNLSYNVSVEFDDYHDRYYWVMKGINFLKDGQKLNSEEPRILWDEGWFISQKIGRADEHKQYRRLFREDDDFNGPLKRDERDNWLVGRTVYLQAQQMVDKGVPIKGITPLLFHDAAPKCLMNYSEMLEEDGTHGEVAERAWRRAGRDWTEYGNRDLPTTYDITIRLNEKELYDRRAEEAAQELDALGPGVREELRKARIAGLSERDRAVVEMPAKERTLEQEELASLAEEGLKIPPFEIADKITGANHAAALKAAQTVAYDTMVAGIIDRYREVVNFNYWRLRCNVEQTSEAVGARKLIFDGDRAFAAADLEGAVAKYEQGLQQWRGVLDANPRLIKESSVVDELMDVIKHYGDILAQSNRQLPENFVLQDVIDQDAVNSGMPRKNVREKEKEQQPPGTPGSPPEAIPEPKPAAAAPTTQT